MTLGARIAKQRKKLGLSQEALGNELGVSRQAIYKWESDGSVPEIDKLIALSKRFGVTIGWLLGVEEDQPESPDNSADDLTDTQIPLQGKQHCTLLIIQRTVFLQEPMHFSCRRNTCLI